MTEILQPKVVLRQQLKVLPRWDTLQLMDDTEKIKFSQRLNELCDEAGDPKHGRQTLLGKRFKASQEAARKWLEGESIPSYSRLVKICAHYCVNFEWLTTGFGQKYRHQEGLLITDPLIIHAAQVMEGMPQDYKEEGVQRIDDLAKWYKRIEEKKHNNNSQ